VVGPHAADALAPVATAIAAGAMPSELAQVWPANPTTSEIAPMAARTALDLG
jgi:pyruvate/2-oxoglutarate dehydrogenase complex dihydrolipoamide dehydrogenase (E3) component